MFGRGLRFGEERALARLGFLGIALSMLCGILYLWKGGLIPPHGELVKPIAFNLALGIFLLTTAVYVPIAGFGEKGKRRFRGLTVFWALYFYGDETVQMLWGVDPQFAGTGLYAVQGILFGVVSLFAVCVTAALIRAVFRRATLDKRPIIVLGIRYGFVSVLSAFAAGLWIFAQRDHFTGLGGNIMAIHFLGFHGLQAVPFTAWLLEKTPVEGVRAARLVHAAGALWLAATVAACIQTALGRALYEPTAASGAFCLLLLFWFSLTANSLMLAWRNRAQSAAN